MPSSVLLHPGSDPARCSPADIRAFLLKRGEALWMEKGSWHWLPYPTTAAKATMLLHFSEATGDRDIEFCDLAQPLSIEAAEVRTGG